MSTPAAAEQRGLTPFGRSLATGGAVLLFLGLVFGSFPYMLCALVLLASALGARNLHVPDVRISRALDADDVRTGEPLSVHLQIENHDLPVGISLYDKVPDAFALEAGRNFDVAFLEKGARADLVYTLRAPRRGAHDIGPLTITAYDPLFAQSARTETRPETSTVAVHPRAPPVPRIRTAAAWGRSHFPGGDRASRGILTNDFRELRPYERGDPLKQVNWKATARMSRGDDLTLIVNDYEVEGKKVVWLFLDASPYTVGGTTLQNHFDELAIGAMSVAGHYLNMGHRVGFTIYGSGQPRFLYADSGDMQERRISALIATTSPGEPGESIGGAVEAVKGFLAREKPLIFLFTLAGRDPTLGRALVSARAIASTGRRAAPVMCVAPSFGEDLTVAGRILAVRERAQLKGLERRGVSIVRYDPESTPLQALLARGVMG